jgi:hypothetical protein
VSPRAVLDAVVKRKIPSPRRKSNPRTSCPHKQFLHYSRKRLQVVNPETPETRIYTMNRPNEYNKQILLNYKQQNISSETDSRSAAQEIPRLLRNPKVHCSIHKGLPVNPVLNQFSPFNTLTPCLRSTLTNSRPRRLVTIYRFTASSPTKQVNFLIFKVQSLHLDKF